MKFIGQYIQSFIARFRNDVYLEDTSTGTIASGGNLGLDSNNKIVKATVSTSVTDLHDAGVDGSANQLLTDDGDGTVTSEARLTFDGNDLSCGDNVILTSAAGRVDFAGTAGGGFEAITYKDSAGTQRNALFFPGSNVVALSNRGSNGTVQIRANTSTAGSGGEVTAATFTDTETTIAGNLTIAGDITSVGDDVSIGDDLLFTSAGAIIKFMGTTGGNSEGVAYKDSGGTERFGLLFPGSNVVALCNRATDGVVQIRANGGSAGSGGEVTAATFTDTETTIAGGLTFDSVALTAVQTSSESFADNDTSIMTSAAIDDKINTKYSTSYITFSVKTSSTYGTNYIMLHGNGISGGLVSIDSTVDSATDFGGVTAEDAGGSTETCDVATGNLEQQIPIPETCKLMGFYATTTTTTNTGAAYDTGVAIWHVPEANVNWGSSTAGEATLIHKSDSSMHAENTAHGGANRKKVQKVERMGGTAKTLAAGDIIVPSVFGETANQQITATITLVIATPIKTI